MMKSIAEFDFTYKTNTGGMTGSVRVTGKNSLDFYQFKYSILDTTKISRRVKGWLTGGLNDRENFGEVIASYIGRALLSEALVPEVSLVYDENNKKVAIASKYLGNGKTLDYYAFEEINIPKSKGKRHIVLNNGSAIPDTPGQLFLTENSTLPISDICESLVLAAIVGDHDVNPGNLVVLDNNNSKRVARIDLGHAFYDLLNTSKRFGGRFQVSQNPVLDFFNRTSVAGAKPGGDISKFKRDYMGFCPSKEMVEALRKLGSKDAETVKKAVTNAQAEFQSLYLKMNEFKDKKGIKNLKNSLSAIYKNLTGKQLSSSLPFEKIGELAFETILNKTLENMNHANNVANIMELQLEIASIGPKNPISKRGEYLISIVTKGNPCKKIRWVSTDKKDPGFKGTVAEYIKKKNAKALSTNKITRPEALMFFNNAKTPQVLANSRALDDLKLALKMYINKVGKEINPRIKIKGFSKTDKIKAAETLLSALDSKSIDNDDFLRHAAALKNGRLAKLIKKFIGPCTIYSLIKALQDGKLDASDKSSKTLKK